MAEYEELAQLVISLKADISDLQKKLGEGKGHLKTFSDHHGFSLNELKKHWIVYTAAVTGAVLTIRSLAAPFADLTHKMLEVNTITKLSNESLSSLTNEVRNLSAQLPQNTKELSAALYDVVSAGVDASKSINVLGLSAKAAVAGVTDTKTALNAGIGVINAYGKNIDELERVYDLLFKTVEKGIVTFPELSNTIGTVLPNARAANIEFIDIAASIALMTKNKIAASEAATYLKGGITALTAPSEQAEKVMKQLGITWNGWIPTLEQLSRSSVIKDPKLLRDLIPDVRARTGILTLVQNFGDLTDILNDMGKSTGAMQAAFKIMENSPINQVKQLGNAFNDLKISIANFAAPAVLKIIRGFTEELKILGAFSRGMAPETIRTLNWINDVLPKIENRQEAANTLFNKRLELLKQIESVNKKIKDLEDIGDKENTGFGLLKFQEESKQLKLQFEIVTKALTEYSTSLDDVKKKTKENVITPKTPVLPDLDALIAKLKVLKEQLALQLDELDQKYDNGLINLREYFDTKRKIVQEGYNEEINVLKTVIKYETDDKKRKDLISDLTVKEIQLKRELLQLTNEENEEVKKLYENKKRAAEIISEVETRLSNENLNKYAKEIAALNEKHEAEKKQLEEIKGLKNKQEQLDKLRDLQSMERSRLLGELEKQQVIDNLDEISKLTGSLSTVLSDWSTMIKTYNENKLNDLKIEQEQEISLLKAKGASEEEINKALYENELELKKATVEKSKGITKAFFLLEKQSALAHVRISTAVAFMKAFEQQGIYGALSAGLIAIQGAMQEGKIWGEIIAGLYEGGRVHGKSGRDKIPIYATKDEFMQPVPAVKYYGTGIMEAIRQRAIPREVLQNYGKGFSPVSPSHFFDTGGLVENQSIARTLQINNIVDPALFGQYLLSREGNDIIVNIISTNAYNIKKVIL